MRYRLTIIALLFMVSASPVFSEDLAMDSGRLDHRTIVKPDMSAGFILLD